MTDISELKSWIAHAEDDYGAATTLIRGSKPFLYIQCLFSRPAMCRKIHEGVINL